MSILITGGTGFIGINVAEALLERGERVIVGSLDEIPPTAKKRLGSLPGQLVYENIDVCDEHSLAALVQRQGVDRLFPLAAITAGPERESKHPDRVIQVNLLGLISQLRVARDAKIRRIIVPASGSVYGETYRSQEVVDEESPCFPDTIYGISKFSAERTALRLAQLWSLDIIVARIAGTFGPWERDTGLRDFITPHWHMANIALRGGEAVLPTRIPACSWTYSRDIAAGLLHLLDLPTAPHRVFNVSSGLPWGEAITQWPDILAAHFTNFSWRRSANEDEVNVAMPDKHARARMDISRIRQTGWQPQFDPESAYKDYMDWLQLNPDAL